MFNIPEAGLRTEIMSQRIYSVVPISRMRALLTKIVINPSNRATKKIEDSKIPDFLKEVTNSFLEEYFPEMITSRVMLFCIREEAIPNLMRFLEDWEREGELEKLIDEYFSILEKHALEIGRIMEKIIILSNGIMDDLDKAEVEVEVED